MPDQDEGEGDANAEARDILDARAQSSAEAADPQAGQAQGGDGSLNAQYAALKGQEDGPVGVPATLAAMSEQPMAPAAQAEPAVLTAQAAAMVPQAEAEAASAGPQVALARRVVESAQAFTDYMGRAGAIRPTYADAAGVARALKAGGTYKFGQLQEGAIAYVALAALQDPNFVRAVGRLGAEEGGRADLAAALAADPSQVLRTPGADGAAMRAAAALARFGVDLESAGAAVKQSAYSIQHDAWSKAAIAAPQTDLAELKARSAEREPLTAVRGQTLLASLGGLRRETAQGSGRLTPTVAKGLTLAALAVLGQAGEEHSEQVAALLTDGDSAQCLKMARLNLYQCLSVVGPEYEDVFCLGQHAMMETARCVANASGWTPAEGPAQTERAAVLPSSASIMVPVAMSTVGDAGAAALPGDPADATPPGAPPPVAAVYTPVQMALSSER